MNKEIRLGIVGSVDSGKCFAINTPILLYNKKTKPVQDITLLDTLMGDDFKPRKVLQLSSDYSYMYKIIQTNIDGHHVDSYTVNLNHVLCLYSKTLEKIINISLYAYLVKPPEFSINLFGVKLLEDGTHSLSYIRIEKQPQQSYYGFSVDGNHRFLLGDYTITHNSTITGVLTKNILDDGRGKARSLILKHPHEKETGRTSCISQHYIRQHEAIGSEKVINFIDLAGHEKYLKTTISGITKCLVDYAAIVVGSNMGVLCMTKEHINIIMALNIPIFIIMTKIDIAPKHIKQNTIKRLGDIFSRYKRKRELFLIESDADYETFNNIAIKNRENLVPLFMISSVVGTNIDNLRNYIFNLNPLIPYEKYIDDEPNFIIENRYVLKGIGLVVSGVMKSGTIKKGEILEMGPFNNTFRKVIIKNIHNNFKEDVEQLASGHGGSFNIKVINNKENIKRNMIRKGIHILKNPKLIREFDANVLILHHPTTISCGYQPYIHCGNVSQSCQIIDMDKECLRIGEKAKVKFRFLYRPEFILVGAKIIFREGRSKGVGVILEVY